MFHSTGICKNNKYPQRPYDQRCGNVKSVKFLESGNMLGK